MPTIEEVKNSATIYQFLHNPYGVVRAGTYKPNLLDCWALVVDTIPKCFIALWGKMCELSWHMSIRRLFIWLLFMPFWILIVVPMPLTFWIWGTYVYFYMRGEPERHKKVQERLNRKLDSLV